MAPADSLARLRKALMDRAARRAAPVTQLCREAGISRSRFYELRARYLQYGEAGLRPKPRPVERPGRQLPEPLVDAIVAYAVEHPTHGQRTIADALARQRFGGWRVSHGGVANVLRPGCNAHDSSSLAVGRFGGPPSRSARWQTEQRAAHADPLNRSADSSLGHLSPGEPSSERSRRADSDGPPD
jgi:hypothetical protein